MPSVSSVSETLHRHCAAAPDTGSDVRVRVAVLGPVELVAPGQGRAFNVDGEEIAIFRQRDGRVFATQNRCPHRNAPLADGVVGGGMVICPFHARTFNLESGKGCDSGDCLRTYQVDVNPEGQLVLTLRCFG